MVKGNVGIATTPEAQRADVYAIAERVKAVRNWSGKNQREFSELLGVSRSYLSEVEADKGKVSIEMLIGIVRTFPQISPMWLLTGVGSMLLADKEQQGRSQIDIDALQCGLEISDVLGTTGFLEKTLLENRAHLIVHIHNIYMEIVHALMSQHGVLEPEARRTARSRCRHLDVALGMMGTGTEVISGALLMPLLDDKK